MSSEYSDTIRVRGAEYTYSLPLEYVDNALLQLGPHVAVLEEADLSKTDFLPEPLTGLFKEFCRLNPHLTDPEVLGKAFHQIIRTDLIGDRWRALLRTQRVGSREGHGGSPGGL